MPRFFFDLHDGETHTRDEDGVELDGYDQARKEAQRLLPEIAYHEIPEDGDHRSYVILVTDENGKAVYSASLNYHGLWLLR